MLLRTSWLKWAGLRLIVALVIAGGLAASTAAAPTDELYVTYLPTVLRPQPGIQGRVTQGGAPAAGISVELRFYNGSSYSSAGTTTTDGAGVYVFAGAASLGSGQRYYVLYRNVEDDLSRLSSWSTRVLTSFTAGQSVPIGDFDLANFSQTTPGSTSYVSLPRAFGWDFRPATPDDTFDFNLFDPDDGNPFFWTNPPLGHVNGYTLNSLPGGFSTNTWYGWFPGVYSPDGGYGEPYYFWWVAFSNAGQAAGAGEWQVGQSAVNELGAAPPRERK